MKENIRKEKTKTRKKNTNGKSQKKKSDKENGGWERGRRRHEKRREVGCRQGGDLGSGGKKTKDWGEGVWEKKQNFILQPCHELTLNFILSNKPPNEFFGMVHWWVLSHSCPWIWVSTNSYVPNGGKNNMITSQNFAYQ